MINFKVTKTGLEFHYSAGPLENNEWVWIELEKHSEVTISRVFLFELSDLICKPSSNEDFESFTFRFKFGTYINNYIKIPARILDIANDLLISKDIALNRKIFIAERYISIFRHLSELLDHTNPIVIGGPDPEAIPWEAYKKLIDKFPNTTELNKYADARVSTMLSQYINGMKDAQYRYETYLKKRSTYYKPQLDLEAIKKLEIEKYILIRDLVKDALHNKKHWTEKEWQDLMVSFILLLFPKYIMVIDNVTIHDYYSNKNKKTNRFIDIALIDASGNIDIIEIKKPFDDRILKKNDYRGNSIPTSELSGTIMQAEKYLFHLSKWGVKGEQTLTQKYASSLPSGMSIHISNPKAIIIVGRDKIDGSDMSPNQQLDFEIIKRKYAHMMDIITYDDLLRRLENTITALGG
ncbi:Shedu immune nuclease family protein [Lelliottia amnigena]|uniref:Shedu immune nuclease family protein n=1 Tax=Lelliottia amnigena TaxID=61646 RepID=UPI003BA10046